MAKTTSKAVKRTPSVKTIAIVGTGVIGASWATYFLAAGLKVRAYDPAPRWQEMLLATIERNWKDLRKLGPVSGYWQRRLTLCDSLRDAVGTADWVQENGPEIASLKQQLFAQMDAMTAPHVVLASSSTALMPSQIYGKVKNRARMIVAHPFNPPHLVPLVEVVGGPKTSADTIQRAMTFYAKIGKVPVHVRQELPGHIANRLQAALYREAVYLVASGAASVEDVDAAVTSGPGLRWALIGPHLTYHLAGGKGGLAEYLEKLGPSQISRWAALGSPKLDAATKKTLVAGIKKSVGVATIQDLARRRDDQLVGLLKLKRHAASKAAKRK